MNRIRSALALASVAVLAACAAAPAYAAPQSAPTAREAVPTPNAVATAPAAALTFHVTRSAPTPSMQLALRQALGQPDSVRTISSADPLVTVPTVFVDASPQRAPVNTKQLMLTLAGLLVAGSLATVSADKDAYFTSDTIRLQFNRLVAWTYYTNRNGMISTTVATFPGVAIATDTTKVKTANATVLLCGGAVNAFAATDNAFTLTGSALAASKFRKYLLLVDASDVCTVQASSDASTAAACAFSNLPADGKAVVGMITVATDSTHTFTPATTALGAAGITTTYYDGMGDDASFMFAQVTP